MALTQHSRIEATLAHRFTSAGLLTLVPNPSQALACAAPLTAIVETSPPLVFPRLFRLI
jgi:hypothetical protein